MIMEAKVGEAKKKPTLIPLQSTKKQSIRKIKLDRHVLARYVGDYVFDEFTIRVKFKDTSLVFQHPEDILLRLLPASKFEA
jgi:hypothetical protein